MSRKIGTVVLTLLWTCASTVLASAQVTSSKTDASNQIETASSPVAYVYVSSSPSSGKSQINAYAASSTGALSAVQGSPFAANVNIMALNGAWLFGVDNTGNAIDSFSIAANGSLKLADTFTENMSGGGILNMYLDHTGTSLYTDYYTTNNDYLSHSIDNTTGQLAFLNDLPGGPANNSRVSFVGDNRYAYSSSCYHFDSIIYGVQRATDGALSYLNISPLLPTPPSGDFYCPWLAAADPTNNLAIAVQPITSNWGIAGPYQLATYTADNTGNLTTNSTYQNMPRVAVGTVIDYWMSPDGRFLAVGGTAGLQVFHFNGKNPITHFTSLLTTDEADQMFWDNAHHLYVISRTAGKLYVFTVSWKGVTQAPGSPYSITNPEYIIVLPKT